MQDRGLPRHSAVRNIAVGIFLVACVAYFSACDNLGRTMEWPTYSVIYHANDGSGETYYSVTDHGSAHYVLDNMFGGRGLGFLGWAKSPNGEIEFGFDDSRLEPYAAVGVPRLTGRAGDTLRLYAVWDGFVIVFNANGGLGQPPTMLIPSKDAPEYVRLPSVSRFDHDLAGWNTCRYGSEEFFAADGEFLLDGERKNLTLYAIWTPATGGGNVYFTVFFNANGGEGSPIAPITGNAGYGITLPDGSGFSKYGYVFAGWSTMSCGSGALFPAGHEGVAFVGNVSLFAMWTPEGGSGDDSVHFTVEFNLHRGEGNIPPITGNAGYGITLPDGSELSRYGYTFAGWSTRPGGQGVIFPGGYEGAVFARDVTLYAMWVPIGTVFAVTFDPNGGVGLGPLPVMANAGESVILPNQRQFSMHGYIFEGWNTLADGSGNAHSAGEEFTPTGNLTLFAMWEERTWIQISAHGVITAFRNTGAIARLEIPPVINNVPVTAIGEGAFAGYPINSVVIPRGVVSIGDSAFEGNRLSSVAIPDSVAFIGSMAFADNRLSSVVIPGNVASRFASLADNRLISPIIGRGAFAYNPLVSITIPSDVAIASGWCMGEHGEAFLAFYNATGRLAGTYLWIEAEGQWILEGGASDAVFDIRFTGFASGEAGIGFDQSVSILSPEALITVVGGFDEFRWIHDGAIVPGAAGATLDFRSLHGNRMGVHFVTVEVRTSSRWYSSLLRILVTM